MATITALDLIKGAMLKLGVLAEGETPTADAANDGLTALNDVLETWSLEKLSVYGTDVDAFPVTAGKEKYTYGPGGDWDAFRPVAIDSAYATINNVDFDMESWTLDEYGPVAVKQLGGIPQRYVYINDFPLGIVILYPVPAQDMTISVNRSRLLNVATTLATQLDLPPGYNRALRFAVAVEMAPDYPGCNDVSAYARSTKAVIKRSNHSAPVATFDAAITGGVGGGSYIGMVGGGPPPDEWIETQW